MDMRISDNSYFSRRLSYFFGGLFQFPIDPESPQNMVKSTPREISGTRMDIVLILALLRQQVYLIL